MISGLSIYPVAAAAGPPGFGAGVSSLPLPPGTREDRSGPAGF